MNFSQMPLFEKINFVNLYFSCDETCDDDIATFLQSQLATSELRCEFFSCAALCDLKAIEKIYHFCLDFETTSEFQHFCDKIKMTSSDLSDHYRNSGIQFDFYRPDFVRGKYARILQHIVLNSNTACIAGGYFTKYLPTAPGEYLEKHDIDIFVFINKTGSSEHAYCDSQRADELNAFLTEDCRKQFPFIQNPRNQPYCDSSIKQFFIEPNYFSEKIAFSKTWTEKCCQKVQVRFTTASDVPALLSNFDYEPCKIAFRQGKINFSNWFVKGGNMIPAGRKASDELVARYKAKGFGSDFNDALVQDINNII